MTTDGKQSCEVADVKAYVPGGTVTVPPPACCTAAIAALKAAVLSLTPLPFAPNVNTLTE
jgi:hypothetical protein